MILQNKKKFSKHSYHCPPAHLLFQGLSDVNQHPNSHIFTPNSIKSIIISTNIASHVITSFHCHFFSPKTTHKIINLNPKLCPMHWDIHRQYSHIQFTHYHQFLFKGPWTLIQDPFRIKNMLHMNAKEIGLKFLNLNFFNWSPCTLHHRFKYAYLERSICNQFGKQKDSITNYRCDNTSSSQIKPSSSPHSSSPIVTLA